MGEIIKITEDGVEATSGDDRIEINAGAVDAGDGDDDIFINKGDGIVTAKAGFGDDHVMHEDFFEGTDIREAEKDRTPVQGDTIYGGPGDDSIIASKDNDTIDGGFGNDSIRGDRGNDHIYPGEGEDIIYIAPGDGHDTVEYYDTFADTIHTDAGVTVQIISKNDNKYSEGDLTLQFSKFGEPNAFLTLEGVTAEGTKVNIVDESVRFQATGYGGHSEPKILSISPGKI